jgi:hypothetical protein
MTAEQIVIHDSYDSELLVYANRVLDRILATAKKELSGISFSFTHHLHRAKHRNLESIENTIGYGEKGLTDLTSYTAVSLKNHVLTATLTHKQQHSLPIARQVVCQTRHLVLAGEAAILVMME